MKKAGLFLAAAGFVLFLASAASLTAAESNEGGVLVNNGFESSSSDPWYWFGEAGTGTYGVTDYAHSGKQSVEIVADKKDEVTTGVLQDFDCKGGDKFTASAWAMSPKKRLLTNSDAFIRLEFWGGDPVVLLKADESQHLTGAFAWQEISVSSEAPREATKAKIGLFIWNTATGHSGIVYFDDAKLIKQ